MPELVDTPSPEDGSILVRISLDPAAPSGKIIPIPGRKRIDSLGNEVSVQLRFHKGEPPLWVPPSMISLLFDEGPCARYRMPENDGNGRPVYGQIFERVDNIVPPVVPTTAELMEKIEQLQQLVADTVAARAPVAQPVPAPVDVPAPAPAPVAVAAEPEPAATDDGVIETTQDGRLICPDCGEYKTPSDSKNAMNALAMHRRMKHPKAPKE